MRDEIDVQNELRGLIVATLLRKGVRRIDLSSAEIFPAFSSDFETADEFDTLFVDMVIG